MGNMMEKPITNAFNGIGTHTIFRPSCPGRAHISMCIACAGNVNTQKNVIILQIIAMNYSQNLLNGINTTQDNDIREAIIGAYLPDRSQSDKCIVVSHTLEAIAPVYSFIGRLIACSQRSPRSFAVCKSARGERHHM